MKSGITFKNNNMNEFDKTNSYHFGAVSRAGERESVKDEIECCSTKRDGGARNLYIQKRCVR